jgi:parallel beta-helix repeat protein
VRAFKQRPALVDIQSRARNGAAAVSLVSRNPRRTFKTVAVALVGVFALVLASQIVSAPNATASGIQPVGSVTTFAAKRTGTPRTALPAGTQAGNVLVTFVSVSPASSTIACTPGWNVRFDVVSTADERFVGCTHVADGSETRVSATVNPPSQVTMVTAAFSGTDPVNPVGGAASGTGTISPPIATAPAGSMLVFGEGSAAVRGVATAPPGALLGATVNNGRGSQAATATMAYNNQANPWTIAPTTSAAASASILLQPPSAPTTTTTAPTTTTSPPTTTTSPPTTTTSPPTTTTSPPTTTTSPPTTTTSPPTTTTLPPPPGGTAPSTPPAQICGNTAILSGPSTPPSGAVTVPAGDNSSLANSWSLAPNTTYWFAPGVHTLGTSQYAQLTPQDNDVFVGAPGAVIDGQNVNQYAFTQHASGVTIKYLTIRNFVSPLNEGVVNHDSGNGWTITRNSIVNNKGAAMMAGAGQSVTYNCVSDNGQYGMNAYQAGDGITNLVVDHNEFARNNTGNWENVNSGCGCTGGMKFWAVNGATVTNNWIHDNYSVGVWADTNDRNFTITDNYISGNTAEGVFYEISYNATIQRNTFLRNAQGKGPALGGFPTGAIYLSEAGGDSRVAGTGKVDISANVFTDNWSGVVMWENADRFCNSPSNTSSSYCTLGGTGSFSTCVSGTINNQPYYSDCRWKTQNVSVHDNSFQLTPSNIPGCSTSAMCGLNAVFSNWGTSPSWSPYQGNVIENAITFNQNNHFANNQYTGPWRFMVRRQGGIVSFGTWQASPHSQDAGSTIK